MGHEVSWLRGRRVVAMGVNLPLDLTAQRLAEMGARVTKVEPPGGDPLQVASPDWYREIHASMQVSRLDLKAETDRAALDGLLAEVDLLVTATRPSSLRNLGLGPDDLLVSHPHLCSVAITGFPEGPREDEPGHDLTYMAETGLLDPRHHPRTLTADLVGAERTVAIGLALLLGGRESGDRHASSPLSDAAFFMARPWNHGVTKPGQLLGGDSAAYRTYATEDGWIAVAALEPHFWASMVEALGNESAEELERIFSARDSRWWVEWARERDLPIAAVADPGGG